MVRFNRFSPLLLDKATEEKSAGTKTTMRVGHSGNFNIVCPIASKEGAMCVLIAYDCANDLPAFMSDRPKTKFIMLAADILKDLHMLYSKTKAATAGSVPSTYPSSGLILTAVMRRVCDEVNLYGFSGKEDHGVEEVQQIWSDEAGRHPGLRALDDTNPNKRRVVMQERIQKAIQVSQRVLHDKSVPFMRGAVHDYLIEHKILQQWGLAPN